MCKPIFRNPSCGCQRRDLAPMVQIHAECQHLPQRITDGFRAALSRQTAPLRVDSARETGGRPASADRQDRLCPVCRGRARNPSRAGGDAPRRLHVHADASAWPLFDSAIVIMAAGALLLLHLLLALLVLTLFLHRHVMADGAARHGAQDGMMMARIMAGDAADHRAFQHRRPKPGWRPARQSSNHL